MRFPGATVVPHLKFRNAPGWAFTAALALVSSTCTTPTKPGPVVVDLAVQSISPAAGPATGGTEVTLRGTGFQTGIAVSIGGRAATDVTVRGSDSLTARTPPSPVAGAADIVVTSNGRTGMLANGFRYEVVVNTPPTIRSIVAQGKRPRQPANFADYGETITVTAVVEDAQTNPALLTYQWSACGGTFTGTGRQVEWATPASGIVATTCTIELVVSDGPRVISGTLGVRLHNSSAEVAALALEFLEEFADSTIPAELTVRNFTDVTTECRDGKAAELKEVIANRANYRHETHTYGAVSASINFGGTCAFRLRTADACAITPVEWRSIRIDTGLLEIARGISHITAVYQNPRWWLCRSEYQAAPGTSLTFMY